MSLQAPLLGAEGEQKAKESPPTDEKAYLKGIADLPDLTPLLEKQGILGEYVAWRDGYMKWRKGDARGAQGENTLSDHHKRSAEFQTWYPTVKTYSFRRTIAFWGAVTCCEGCLLFLWIDLITTYAIGTPEMLYELTKVPNLVGGFFFMAGIYLSWFELINMDSEKLNANKLHYFWVSIESVTDLGIDKASYVGALTYLLGAVLYTISQVSDFWELTPGVHNVLIDWPLIVGGLMFFLGGVCELKINKVFESAPTRLVWWVAVLNCYGGLTFWLSACPALFPGKLATRFSVTGTITYLLAAVLSLLMWRGEQYGGALILTLNRAAQDKVKPAPNANDQIALEVKDDDSSRVQDALRPRLSWSGLGFLIVSVCISAFSVIACCMCLNHRKDYTDDPETFRRMLNVFITGSVNIIIVHMVLVLDSAIEPYRSLAIMMRVVSVVLFLNTLMELRLQFEDATYYGDTADYFGDVAYYDAGIVS